MEEYVKQLIEEILSKKKPEAEEEEKKWEDISIIDALPRNVELTDEELERQQEKTEEQIAKHIAEVERFINYEDLDDPSILETIGMYPEQFPDATKLTDAQKTDIIEAILEFLLTHHIICDFPEEIPLDLKYKLSVKALDNDYFECGVGFYHMDFCAGWAPDCALGEFCPCLEDFDEDNTDYEDFLKSEKKSNDDLPF